MNYYNDFDKNSAAWLKELVSAGIIPPGDVDDRPIQEVQPDDVRGYTQCHFFAGVGGWSIALAIAGWSAARPVWTGSCPYQPFSVAGVGKGAKDERHLWPEFARLICECEPPTVFGEQVASKLGRQWLSGVRLDLEAMGYGVGAADLCAPGVGSEELVEISDELTGNIIWRGKIKTGAPHIRQRLWWVADAKNSDRWTGERGKKTGVGPDEIGRWGSSVGGPCCGLANPNSNGRHERRPEREGFKRGDAPVGAGWCGGVENPSGARTWNNRGQACNEGWKAVDSRGKGLRQRNGATCTSGANSDGAGSRLGNAKGNDREILLQQGRQEQCCADAGWASGNFWNDSIIIPCADKARRIKPGLAPLVDGLPGRASLLRGYGNAIVPQIAAVFIEAVQEASR